MPTLPRGPLLLTLPAISEDWTLSAIGLRLNDPDLPLERFSELCWILGQMHEAVRFAIGDAILAGEALYGEECYQALEEMNLSEEAKREYVRVAQRVPRSVRRKGLSWSHHRAVASFVRQNSEGMLVPDLPAQRTWLKRALTERMSHHELRDALRNGALPRQATVCRCCGQAL